MKFIWREIQNTDWIIFLPLIQWSKVALIWHYPEWVSKRFLISTRLPRETKITFSQIIFSLWWRLHLIENFFLALPCLAVIGLKSVFQVPSGNREDTHLKKILYLMKKTQWGTKFYRYSSFFFFFFFNIYILSNMRKLTKFLFLEGSKNRNYLTTT